MKTYQINKISDEEYNLDEITTEKDKITAQTIIKGTEVQCLIKLSDIKINV